MKKYLILLFILPFFGFSFGSAVAAGVASERSTVVGAAPLSKGKSSVGFSLGADLPEPLIYGVRYDFGISDRVQLGLGGSTFIIANTFGIYTLFNFLKNPSETDFLSLYITPALLHFEEALLLDENPGDNNFFVFFLQEGLAYEHRFGADNGNGVFLKLGADHTLGAATTSGKTSVGGLGPRTIAVVFGIGFQHTSGNQWTYGIEGKGHFLLDGSVSNSNRLWPTGKIFLTKAF